MLRRVRHSGHLVKYWFLRWLILEEKFLTKHSLHRIWIHLEMIGKRGISKQIGQRITLLWSGFSICTGSILILGRRRRGCWATHEANLSLFRWVKSTIISLRSIVDLILDYKRSSIILINFKWSSGDQIT
jgi:hypothetical protein